MIKGGWKGEKKCHKRRNGSCWELANEFHFLKLRNNNNNNNKRKEKKRVWVERKKEISDPTKKKFGLKFSD